MKLLNAGCGTHYAQGWVNVDIWENSETRPDVLARAGEPYPFEDDTFDAVFMGHVIEHIHWPLVPDFLRDMGRVAKPGAPMFIIGPDVYRTIQRWSEGLEPFWMVESVLEHQELQPSDDAGWWDGAAHHWNCHEDRVVNLLLDLGVKDLEVFSDVVPNGSDFRDPYVDLVWPVVAKADWQCAVRYVNH